jgi:hypothetical protein
MMAFLLSARLLFLLACGALVSLYVWIGWRSHTAK